MVFKGLIFFGNLPFHYSPNYLHSIKSNEHIGAGEFGVILPN
jgi:hypothetical protein